MAETVGIDSQGPQDAAIRSPGLTNGEVLSQDEELLEDTRNVTSKSVHHIKNEFLSHVAGERDTKTRDVMSTSMYVSSTSDGMNAMNASGDASASVKQSYLMTASVGSADVFKTPPRSGQSTPDRMKESFRKSNSAEKSDNQSVETKSSSHSGGDSKDPNRREKEKDREERVRQHREKLAEQRQRKLEELKEQQRIAQELREYQLEMRRSKIQELRKREDERRAAVEDRRKRKEESERARLEALMSKSADRVARYEQWKSSGKKGGMKSIYGFGSRTPRDICQPLDHSKRSSSHNTLLRFSPHGSDSDSMIRPQRRAISACSMVRRHCCVNVPNNTINNKKSVGLMPGAKPPSKMLSMSMGVLYHKQSPDFASSGTLNRLSPARPAESMLALHTIPEKSRSFLANSASTPHRPKSTVNLSSNTGPVQKRETPKTRRPRPASVAGAMPSFIQTESTPRPSPRSKSTDRLSRIDKPRVPRVPKRMEEKLNNTIKEEKKKDVAKEDETDSDRRRVSRRTIDRLSTPKQARDKSEPRQGSAPLPAKEKAKLRRSVTNPPSFTKKPDIKERTVKDMSASKETPPKEAKSRETPPKETKSSKRIVKEKVQKPSSKETSPEESEADIRVRPSDIMTKSFEVPKETPEVVVEETQKKMKKDVLKVVDEIPAIMTASAPALVFGSTKQNDELTEKELYQAKLAEKRRQAREKAEREAEMKRLQEEEERRKEEERLRREEEEQRRMEEESLRLAEEARKLEEERLQKAIEAEEQRRKEEAVRLEQERIAKEEADKRAKEEQERMDKEKEEKKKKEEHERLERKKRLEMIMKRVKPGTEVALESTKPDSPPKSATSSPSKSGQSSSIESGSEDKDEHSDDAEEKKALEVNHDTPKFRSPLLQRLVENKSDISNGETPKFKSPLLQNLLGKTKVGARLGIDNRSDGGESESKESSVGSKSESDSCDEQSDKEADSPVVMRDMDTSDLESSTVMTDSKTSDTLTNGSVGSVIKNELQDSLYSQEPLGSELVDSSISMQTVSSVTTSQCDSVNTSQYETVIEESRERVSKETPNSKIDNDFEELIDLSLTNKNFDGKTTSDDLLNYNSVDNDVDGAQRTPIIAFEDTTRKQDVSDLFS